MCCFAGVITAVAIQCAPKPASVQLAFLSCPSFTAVQQVLKHAKRSLGEILSAVEFLDQESMKMATQYLPGVSNPLTQAGPDATQQQQQHQQGGEEQGGPFYMVVETQGSNAAHDKEKLEGFLEVGAAAVARLIWLVCLCVLCAVCAVGT
jgi:D-2-hydroxyglutarate dehydrogenase